jgi:hypothetical protein
MIFNDDKEMLTIFDANDDPNSMLQKPYSIYITNYEHIQSMTVRATANDVAKFAGANFVNATDEINEFIATSGISPAYGFTTSVTDVTDRQGSKPTVFDTDSYGSGGENRSERSNKLIPHGSIKVNADGSIDEDSAKDAPTINRTITTRSYRSSEAFTPEGFTTKEDNGEESAD